MTIAGFANFAGFALIIYALVVWWWLGGKALSARMCLLVASGWSLLAAGNFAMIVFGRHGGIIFLGLDILLAVLWFAKYRNRRWNSL